MRSTTEKQWRDPKWWNENAGSASYYCPVNAQFYDLKLHPCCIPRPTQWQGPQDGLPPEGTNCRVVQTINNYMVCKDATITYQGAGVGCYINNDNGMEYSVSHHDYSFRLIETEKDKATYELARDLGDICPMPEVVNKVIDLGYRKPIDRAEAYDRAIKSVGVTDANEKAVSLILDALGYKD